MKKLAFITHTFHQKSHSSAYFIDILKQEYQVDIFWDEQWNNGEGFNIDDVNAVEYDCVLFYQLYPSPNILKHLKCRNITWMPMYDTEVNKKDIRYIDLVGKNIKIISFSKKLFYRLQKFGLDVIFLQFFTEPLKRINLNNKMKKVFFWPRVENINWNTVKKLLGKNFKGEITLQNVPDPNNTFQLPSKEDIKKYNIKIIDKWLPFDEILRIRSSADIFIAPREYEGIGLSFLEAMSSGIAVISPNESTMNEYIQDGYNGYLYDMHAEIKAIDFTNLESVKEKAYNSIKEGYGEWEKEKLIFKNVFKKKYQKPQSFFLLCKYYFYICVAKLIKFLKKFK